MAVGVEHRHEQQYLAVEQAGAGLALQQVADQLEARVLPSISPAWIPPRTRTTGRPRACAVLGSSAPLVETAIAFIGRPSGVVPKSKQRTAAGYARWNASQSATTSS